MTKLVAENRKALADYEIKETFEAGIKLTGAEMKSIRERRVDLRHSFVRILNEEPYVLNLKIHRYQPAGDRNYDPQRTRKLLLQRKEIGHLAGLNSQKGVLIVPLRLYLENNVVKLEIGVGKKRKQWDKRRLLKERDERREIEQAVKSHLRL